MTTRDAILEFVRELGRLQYSRDEIAIELETLGTHGKEWPRATCSHWRREIDWLISNGSLDELNGAVRIAKESESKLVQGSLL